MSTRWTAVLAVLNRGKSLFLGAVGAVTVATVRVSAGHLARGARD